MLKRNFQINDYIIALDIWKNEVLLPNQAQGRTIQ